jgi:hypothetical protein
MKQTTSMIIGFIVIVAVGLYIWKRSPLANPLASAPAMVATSASPPAPVPNPAPVANAQAQAGSQLTYPQQLAVSSPPATDAPAPDNISTDQTTLTTAGQARQARAPREVRFRDGDSHTLDLGDVLVEDGQQLQYRLNNGQLLVITPTVLRNGSITLSAQTSGMKNSGNTTSQDSPKITALPGTLVVLNMGTASDALSIRLTPKVEVF